MQAKDPPIIVEQVFNTSRENIWRAITELDQMRQWFFNNIESFKPRPGFETQFNVRSGGRDFLHIWKLIEVIPQEKIIYNWKYKDYPGDSNVTFQLIKKGNKTILKLMHDILEDFPNEIPEFSRESCSQGWNFFIQQSLKDYINSKFL